MCWCQGFFQLFAQGGYKMILYGLLGGQVHIRVQNMWQTRGVREHVPLGNFDLDLLLDATWWNLGLFSHIIYDVLCH